MLPELIPELLLLLLLVALTLFGVAFVLTFGATALGQMLESGFHPPVMPPLFGLCLRSVL
jgi:hypothetical protein